MSWGISSFIGKLNCDLISGDVDFSSIILVSSSSSSSNSSFSLDLSCSGFFLQRTVKVTIRAQMTRSRKLPSRMNKVYKEINAFCISAKRRTQYLRVCMIHKFLNTNYIATRYLCILFAFAICFKLL